MWLIYAFAGPVLWSISMHLDKYLVERYFKSANPAVLLVFTSLIGIVMLPVVWVIQPAAMALPLWSIVVITATGVTFMAALLLYFAALQEEEASVVAPFFQVSPVFGYVLGYIFLHETLTAVQTLGGVLIIGGTILLSHRSGGAHRFNTRLVVLMLTCALILSTTSLVFKIFAIRDDFWTTTFWTFVGQALFGVIMLAIPGYRRQFFIVMRANPGALLLINAVNEIVNLVGSLGARYALVLAPLSLVQAVTSTTTLFVFLLGVALSVFMPAYGREDLTRRSLVRKGLSALVIVIGVVLVGR
jgi:drug/metabolite transporter (DMT)-like permease